jgi:hypothetical protein
LHFYVSKKALFSLPSRENPFPFFKGKDCSSEKQVTEIKNMSALKKSYLLLVCFVTDENMF